MYRGTVVKGVVIPEAGVMLQEGLKVRIEPIESELVASRHFQPVVRWAGPLGEIDRLIRETQQLRGVVSSDINRPTVGTTLPRGI